MYIFRSCKKVLSRCFKRFKCSTECSNCFYGFLLKLLVSVSMAAILFLSGKLGYEEVSNAIVTVSSQVSTGQLPSEDPAAALALDWNVTKSSNRIVLSFQPVNDSLFIPTYSTTIQQKRNKCAEDREVFGALCNPCDNQCVAGRSLVGGNGNMTGRCISSQSTPIYCGCEINGWCLDTKETVDLAEVTNVKDMVLVVQSDVQFPSFPDQGILRNYDENMMSCLKDKRLHSADDPWCPLFNIGDILDRDNSVVDGKQVSTYKEVTRKGATFLIHEVWDCNFDVKDPAKQCSVNYTIRRMDTPIKDFDAHSQELRYVKTVDDVARTVLHLEGIRFIVRVEGKARKFTSIDFFARLAIATAATVGLIAIVFGLVQFFLWLRKRFQH